MGSAHFGTPQQLVDEKKNLQALPPNLAGSISSLATTIEKVGDKLIGKLELMFGISLVFRLRFSN